MDYSSVHPVWQQGLGMLLGQVAILCHIATGVERVECVCVCVCVCVVCVCVCVCVCTCVCEEGRGQEGCGHHNISFISAVNTTILISPK